MTSNRFVSFADRVLEHSEATPDQRAVVCDGQALTYGVLASKARRCAGRIQALGLKPGGAQRVGVLASNGLDFAVVVTACQLAGVPVVPLPVLVVSSAQAAMIEDSNVVVLFHDNDCAEKAHAVVDRLSGRAKLLLVAIGAADALTADASSLLDRWLDAEASPFTPVAVEDDWVSDLIYSSGTTGSPKGITQSHGGRKAQCVSLARLGLTNGAALVNTVGLYSNFGLSALLLALWWGGTYFMMRKFSGQAMADILLHEKIEMAWFAPATLIRTMEAAGFKEAVRGKPCSKLCAGAPLSQAEKQRVLDSWPGPFYEVYGQTETGTLTLFAMHSAPASKLGSVGTVLPTVSVRIIDDAGQVVPAGEEGEIVGHSTTLMSGYHEREEANASVHWRDEAGRLYVRTGDVGKLDSDGYLWLCDRKKDMIISGGYNVYPADIERAFHDHPAVFEVAVVGFASARWGETAVAFVVLGQDAETDEDELRAWVNSRVGAAQRVAAVKVLPDLPRGAMDKVLKRELRERFMGTIGLLP